MKLGIRKNEKIPVCDLCQSPMQQDECPVEIITWRIPLTHYELRLWHWQIIYFCMECAKENEREQRDQYGDAAYNAGFERGYEQGINGRNL